METRNNQSKTSNMKSIKIINNQNPNIMKKIFISLMLIMGFLIMSKGQSSLNVTLQTGAEICAGDSISLNLSHEIGDTINGDTLNTYDVYYSINGNPYTAHNTTTITGSAIAGNYVIDSVVVHFYHNSVTTIAVNTTVNVNSLPNITVNVTDAKCFYDTIGHIEIISNSLTTNLFEQLSWKVNSNYNNYLVNNLSNTSEYDFPIGKDTLIVTAFATAAQCSVEIPVEIRTPDTIKINSVSTTAQTICDPHGNGSISFSVVGGTGQYNVIHNVLQDTVQTISNYTIENLSATQHPITVIDSNNCSIDTTIQVLSSLVGIDSITHTDNICYGDAIGTITVYINGGVSPYTVFCNNDSIITNTNIVTFDSLTAGEYTIYVRDTNRCLTTQYVDTISENPRWTPEIISLQITNVSCDRSNMGSISIIAEDATRYSWGTNANFVGNFTDTTGVCLSADTGYHYLYVMDSNGCVADTVYSFYVDQDTIPVILATADMDTICAGDTVTFTATGGDYYVWYCGNDSIGTGDSISIQIDSTCIIMAEGFGNGGCSSVDTISIVVNPIPTVTENLNFHLCANTNISTSYAINAFNYDSNISYDTTATTFEIIGNTLNVYAEFTNQYGCRNRDTAQIQLQNVIIPSNFVDSITICRNNINEIQNIIDSTISQYANDYDSVTTIREDHSDFCDIEYTFNIGTCSEDVTQHIFIREELTIDSINVSNPLCFGYNNGTISVYTNRNTVNYEWNDDFTANGSFRVGLAIGTYNVTISDNDAVCSIDTTVTLTQPDSLQVIAYTEKDFDCTPGIASISVRGGVKPYQLVSYSNIEWRDTIENTTYSYCVIDNLNDGQYTFTVIDSNGCTTYANTITIADNNLVTTINSSNLSCYNVNSGTIAVNVTRGNAPYIIICDNDSVNADSYTFDSLDAGAHVITVIDSLGCQTSDTIVLTEPDDIAISVNSITNEYCGMPGSISIVADGGTGTLDYQWSNGSTGQIVNNLTNGNYTVTVTDDYNCQTNQTFTVGLDSMPTLYFDMITMPRCYGDSNGTAFVTYVGTHLVNTWLWDNNATYPFNNALTSGWHQVTVSDNRGCVITDSVLIPSVEPIQIYLSGRNANCNFGGLIQIDSINGGTAPYNVLWNNNSTSNTITSPTQNTPYIVTVRDNHNCTATDTISIGLDSSPHIDSVITLPANCYGDSNGSAQAFVSGGTGQLTYVWYPSPIQSIYNTADNLSAGDYMIVVSDSNQCRDTMTFTIEQPEQLTVVYTTENVNCDATILGYIDVDTVTAGNRDYRQYLNGADKTGIQYMNNLVPDNYILEIVDDHGCSTTENINIGQYPTPTISAHLISNVLCNGDDNGSAYVYTNASNPSILWNESQEQTDTATQLRAGINTVTVTDDHNCVVSASVQVAEPQAITSIITTYITNCTEGNAVVTAFGGTDTLMFEWSNGYTTNQISNITIGAPYYVTITDGNGCTKVDSAIVYLPQNPLAVNITAESILCNGGFANATANATGGYGNYSYYWDNQTTNSQNWPLNAGMHTVTVIDVNGCSATSNITISEPNAVSFDTAIISNAHCNSTTGSICLNVSGGTQPFNFTWSGYPYNTCCPTGINPGTYTVTVTDGNNCTATNTYTIGIDPTPTATATLLSDVLCHGDHTGSALVTTNALNPTILWNESQEQTAIATQLGAGINTVTVMDIHGCTATATVQINEPQAITTTVNTYMTNCSIGNAIVNATGGTGLLSYNWGNGNTTNQISNLTIGALYTVTITDENGCTKIDSVTVYLPQNPLTVSITPENILCNGGFANATANATGGSGTYVSYIWDNQTTSTQTAMLQAGTHTVTVIDGNGCSATANITMAEPDAIVFGQAIVTNANCNSATGSICVQVSGGTQPFNYSWNNYPYNTCCPTGMNPGSYTVTVTDANGCTATNNYTIGIDPAPVASITTSNTHICAGDLVNITATGGTFYQWNTGSNASTVSMTLTSPMTFIVTVTDVHGCSDTASIYIDVHQQPTLSFNLIDDICYDDNIVDLSQYCNPNYGVIFDGVGVSGNYFYPVNAVGGNMPITATYTDANGCSVSVMESIYVHPMPNATWNAEFPNMCINSQPIQLTGGIPTGGIYTGDGVTNGYFDPAQAGVGLKHIYYVYTDQYGCDIVLNKTITVSNIQNIAWYPESDYYQCGNPSILTVFPDGGEMKVDGWSIAHYNGNPGMFILHPDDYSIGTHVLSYELNNGCAANASVPIYIHPCNNNTGIEDEESSSSISLFPNPTKSNITIRWDEQQDIERIQLFNTVGKKINELTANGNSVEINLSELPNSIYFVRLVSKDGVFTTHKVIKE